MGAYLLLSRLLLKIVPKKLTRLDEAVLTSSSSSCTGSEGSGSSYYLFSGYVSIIGTSDEELSSYRVSLSSKSSLI